MRASGFHCVRRRAAAALAVASAAAAIAGPAAAGAAMSKYPAAAARGFGEGASGWSSSTGAEGACLAPVLCASVENSAEASGGADGGGFIRSAYTGAVGASAVGGTSRGVWESPSFVYAGAAGEEAKGVSFSLDRRASVDQLLAVAGNSAEYTVRLIDLGESGEATTLIAPTTLAGARAWAGVTRSAIDPASLTPGHEYRIQIISSYTTGTTVLVSGSADYDNVVLAASDGAAGGGKAKGNRKGKGGAGGSGALGERRLEQLLRQGTPTTAVLRGKRVFVRVRCPRKIGHACRTTAQGLLRKRRPATGKRTVLLRSGRSRLIALPVKPKAGGKVAKRKRLLFQQRVRAGRVTATVYKTRRLIRR